MTLSSCSICGHSTSFRDHIFTFELHRLQKQPPEMFYEAILKNFSIFKEKILCWSLFLNNVAGLRSATLLKKRFQHMCFPMNIFKNTFFEEHLWTAVSTGVQFEPTNFAISVLRFSFPILQRHNSDFEIQVLNFSKYRYPRFNCSVKFFSSSSHQVNLQNFASPLHFSVLQHFSIIWWHPFLHLCLSLCYFTCSL